MSGALTDRPALHDAIEFARSGDTIIVWKLDRLARSMKQLIETIETLRVWGIGFRSLTEALVSDVAPYPEARDLAIVALRDLDHRQRG
jgi:DNA invertase Pin-like site-specific DNA recombinase